PLSPAGAYRFAPDPISKKEKIKIQQKNLLVLMLETTKTLVYALSTGINGEAYVAVNPSFRGLLPRLDRSPGAQRLGPGSSEGRRPSVHQRQCRARSRVHRG